MSGGVTKNGGSDTATPRVSVIVPAWNAARYLSEAIGSLLAQTFQNFEVIVIDDGSTDDTYEIALRHVDSRITVIRHETNSGPAAARNTGIRHAKGAYIALLDADDTAYPERLALQVEALDKDSSLVMVGSHISLMTATGEPLHRVFRRPITPDETAIALIFGNALSAVTMFRKDRIPVGGYRTLRVSEDYDFNMRMALRGKVTNLDVPLTYVRIRRDGLTGQYSDLMFEKNKEIVKEYLKSFNIDPSDRELEVNGFIGKLHLVPSYALLDEVEMWLEKLAVTNDRLSKYDKIVFWRMCGREWFEVCKYSTPLGLHALRRYSASRLSEHFGPGAVDYLKMLVKSAIRHRRVVGKRRSYD